MTIKSSLGKPISVRLPEDLRTRIELLAKTTRRSQGDVVREVLERDLEKLEWEHRLIASVADLRAGRQQTVSLIDIENELGLDQTPVNRDVLNDIE